MAVVKSLEALAYQGEIVGIRAETNSGRYYDMSIDSLKTHGVTSLCWKRQVRLRAYGRRLLTKAEYEKKIKVQDISENAQAMSFIVPCIRVYVEEAQKYKTLV